MLSSTRISRAFEQSAFTSASLLSLHSFSFVACSSDDSQCFRNVASSLSFRLHSTQINPSQSTSVDSSAAGFGGSRRSAP